jgi:hypothetical protein
MTGIFHLTGDAVSNSYRTSCEDAHINKLTLNASEKYLSSFSETLRMPRMKVENAQRIS